MKTITVAELIERLSKHDPNMYVALADWNEDYESPSMAAAAEQPRVEKVREWNGKDYGVYKCVILGGSDE